MAKWKAMCQAGLELFPMTVAQLAPAAHVSLGHAHLAPEKKGINKTSRQLLVFSCICVATVVLVLVSELGARVMLKTVKNKQLYHFERKCGFRQGDSSRLLTPACVLQSEPCWSLNPHPPSADWEGSGGTLLVTVLRIKTSSLSFHLQAASCH